MIAEQVTEAVAEHAEGPVWWESLGALRYVDMLAGDVHTLHHGGELTRTRVGTVAAALRPRESGGAVLALERSFAITDQDDLSRITDLGEVWTDPAIRFNDGGCDPDGRFYCGSMAYDASPGAAALYQLSADENRTTRKVLTGVTVSNGLGFSPDGQLAYYNDTPTGRTDVFDYESDAGLVQRRPFVDFKREAKPDGLCVDAEGGVWIALWGSGAVHRYDSEGALDAVVTVNATQATACTFGGPDLDTLYITTSRKGKAVGEEPDAGAVFAVQPGIKGLLPLPFRG